MKKLLLSISILSALNSFAKLEFEKVTFSPYVEYSNQKYNYFTPGARFRYLLVPYYYPTGAEIHFGHDIHIGNNYRPNIRLETSIFMFLIVGISTQYIQTNQGSVFTLGPKTGFNFYALEFNYSYNPNLTKRESNIGNHRFGIKFDLETIFGKKEEEEK